MRAPASDLTGLLHGLVDGPVQAQALLDRGWVDAVTRWRDIVQFFIVQAPPADRPDVAAALAPTAPIRQVLHRYELECSVRLRIQTRRGAGIRVQPLDLGWEIIRGETRSSASRVIVEVRSVPVPVASSVEARASAWTSPSLLPPEEGDH